MSVHDWIAMEEQLMKRDPEQRALLAEKVYQPPSGPRRTSLFARLANLLHRRPKQKEEPQPIRPAFR